MINCQLRFVVMSVRQTQIVIQSLSIVILVKRGAAYSNYIEHRFDSVARPPDLSRSIGEPDAPLDLVGRLRARSELHRQHRDPQNRTHLNRKIFEPLKSHKIKSDG